MYTLDYAWMRAYIKANMTRRTRYEIDSVLIEAGYNAQLIDAAWQELTAPAYVSFLAKLQQLNNWLEAHPLRSGGCSLVAIVLQVILGMLNLELYALTRLTLFVCVGLACLTVAGLVLSRSGSKPKENRAASGIGVGLTLVAVLVCLTSFFGAGPLAAPLVLADKLGTGQHLYYLYNQGNYSYGKGSPTGPIPSKGTLLKVNRCDTSGSNCNRLNFVMYDDSVLDGRGKFRLELAPDGQNLRIVVDRQIYFVTGL